MSMTKEQIAACKTYQELRNLYRAQPENKNKTTAQMEFWIKKHPREN